MLQSYCLERNNQYKVFCSEDSEDTKLQTVGIALLVAVAISIVNTCLSKNINLPHSYEELKELYEQSESGETDGAVRCDGPVPVNDSAEPHQTVTSI